MANDKLDLTTVAQKIVSLAKCWCGLGPITAGLLARLENAFNLGILISWMYNVDNTYSENHPFIQSYILLAITLQTSEYTFFL